MMSIDYWKAIPSLQMDLGPKRTQVRESTLRTMILKCPLDLAAEGKWCVLHLASQAGHHDGWLYFADCRVSRLLLSRRDRSRTDWVLNLYGKSLKILILF